MVMDLWCDLYAGNSDIVMALSPQKYSPDTTKRAIVDPLHPYQVILVGKMENMDDDDVKDMTVVHVRYFSLLRICTEDALEEKDNSLNY
jgi:hypothetical protein